MKNNVFYLKRTFKMFPLDDDDENPYKANEVTIDQVPDDADLFDEGVYPPDPDWYKDMNRKTGKE